MWSTASKMCFVSTWKFMQLSYLVCMFLVCVVLLPHTPCLHAYEFFFCDMVYVWWNWSFERIQFSVFHSFHKVAQLSPLPSSKTFSHPFPKKEIWIITLWDNSLLSHFKNWPIAPAPGICLLIFFFNGDSSDCVHDFLSRGTGIFLSCSVCFDKLEGRQRDMKQVTGCEVLWLLVRRGDHGVAHPLLMAPGSSGEREKLCRENSGKKWLTDISLAVWSLEGGMAWEIGTTTHLLRCLLLKFTWDQSARPVYLEHLNGWGQSLEQISWKGLVVGRRKRTVEESRVLARIHMWNFYWVVRRVEDRILCVWYVPWESGTGKRSQSHLGSSSWLYVRMKWSRVFFFKK